AAHVEADDLVEAGHLRGLDRADHTAGRAGEDGVLALEQVGGGEPAGGLHEHQPWAAVTAEAELAGNLVDVAAQDRREVGVDHGGVAAADQLHQRRDLVADGDLRKADLAGDLGDALLVLGE